MDTWMTMQSRWHYRTLGDIRSRVTERSKQNAISRAFHAKNDSQTIASWRMDLNRILLVFNVRSVVFVLSALTVHSQTELGLNIYGTISDVHDGVMETHTVVTDTHTVVSDTHTIVSEVQCGVAETHTMVSEIRREILGGQKGANSQLRSVSDTDYIYH